MPQDFTHYRRTNIAEMRPWVPGEDMSSISVSSPDAKAGSPKAGDMIARNPENHADQWLVSEAYFAANFGPIDDVGLSDELAEHAAAMYFKLGASFRRALEYAVAHSSDGAWKAPVLDADDVKASETHEPTPPPERRWIILAYECEAHGLTRAALEDMERTFKGLMPITKKDSTGITLVAGWLHTVELRRGPGGVELHGLVTGDPLPDVYVSSSSRGGLPYGPILAVHEGGTHVRDE